MSAFPRKSSLAALAAVVLPTIAVAGDFTVYANARYGTSAEVPAGFSAEPPPANGDGQRFTAPGGGSVTVFGSRDFDGTGLDGYRVFLEKTLASEGWDLTYQTKGDGWFVLSGKRRNEILYRRTQKPAGCAKDAMHNIEFRYPETAANLWQPIVEHGAATLSGPCK